MMCFDACVYSPSLLLELASFSFLRTQTQYNTIHYTEPKTVIHKYIAKPIKASEVMVYVPYGRHMMVMVGGLLNAGERVKPILRKHSSFCLKHLTVVVSGVVFGVVVANAACYVIVIDALPLQKNTIHHSS